MATAKIPLTLDQMEQQNADLDRQQAILDAKVQNTGSFFSEATPTSPELNLDIQQRALNAKQDTLQSNILARKVYGDTTAMGEDTASKQGLVGGIVNTLSAPLYGVVGAAKYALGKSDQPTFGESVMENVKSTKDTWGNLLRQMGTAPLIAAPLGFGLDVITDPVNLATGGWAGLERTALGKIVTGAAKAGKEGLVAGAKTATLDLASRIASVVPGMNVDTIARDAAEKLAKEGVAANTPEYIEAVKKAFIPADKGVGNIIGNIRYGIKNLYEKTLTAKNNYDDVIGFDMGKMLDARAERESIADKTSALISSIPKIGPLPSGVEMADFFSYNSNKWTQNAILMNKLDEAMAKAGRVAVATIDPQTGEKIYPGVEELMRVVKNVQGLDPNPIAINNDIKFKDLSKMIEDWGNGLKNGADVMHIPGEDIRVASTPAMNDAFTTELRNTNVYNDLNNALRDMMGKADLSAVDKFRNWVSKGVWGKNSAKKVEYGKKLLNSYDFLMGWFKNMKISSLSPSSLVYAILGNGTMQHMAGVNMLRPEVFNRMKDAAVLMSGGKIPGLGGIKEFDRLVNELIVHPKDRYLSDFFTQHSDLARQNFALSGRTFGVHSLADDIINSTIEQERKVLGRDLTTMERNDIYNEIYANRSKEVDALLKSDTGLARLSMMNGTMPAGKESTGILANELAPHKAFLNWKNSIAEKAAAPGASNGVKFLNWTLNRSNDFQMTDQIWKLQNFLLLTQDGVTERELMKLTNNFMSTTARINSSDIIGTVTKGGQKYYRIAPEKAMEIANETFMNYAAMPGFVKMVRSMPILGSPFFSFTYAMLQKTAKTMVNNPAALNQINFLLQEMQPPQTPLEREALKTKAYSYLSQPGMVNLGENFPFFTGNPLYLNLAQMVPYYSLNILNQSTRNFNDTARGKVATVLDKSPLMKDPVGQLLMDYVVLPSLMYDETPTNMFGGQLYPTGTSASGKLGYATRSLAEALTPSTVAPVGLVTPDYLKNLLPSYPARKLGYAAEGKTAVGVQTKEPPAQKGLRALLSTMGVNLYPVNLTMVATEVKNKQLP